MNKEIVKQRLDKIREAADKEWNHECHMQQDQLLIQFIAYIACEYKGQGFADLAAQVLEVEDIDFERWYS